MCNLYRLNKASAEIAKTFGAQDKPGVNFTYEVYPGYTGLVIANGQIQSMTRGFPLALKGRDGRQLKPKPVRMRGRTNSSPSFGVTVLGIAAV
jgi:putative SOS response-associated peptidase YedK